MPPSNKRVPAIRFSGFVEEWKENTMGSLGTFSKGAALSKADISDEGFPLILYGELYTAYGEIIEKVYRKTRKEVGNEQKSQGGDVIIPTSGETPDEISSAACVMILGVILAGDLSIYRNCCIDGRIVSYIVRHVINKQIASIAQGKSVVHIRMDELAKIPLIYPSQMEQQKLATFLSNVDKLIELRKNKLDKLIALKKELLNKLFPQQGQKIPAIRFSGFVEEWRPLLIEQMGDVVGGGTPNTANPVYWNGSIRWFTPSEVGHEKYVKDSKRMITPLGLQRSSAKLLPAETILLSTRATIGECSITRYPCATNQGFQSVVISKEFDKDFCYYIILTKKEEMKGKASGSTFLEISNKEVRQIECKVPILKEQNKISSLLSAFDKLIELRKKEVDKMTALKKELLNKLFVG